MKNKNNQNELPQEPDVLVEMGELKQASNGRVIGSFGISSCIGAAVYNFETKVGYVAHTNGIDMGIINLLINQLVSDGGAPQNLRVWMTGGLELLYSPHNSRHEAVHLFLEHGVATENIITNWVLSPDQGADIMLNTATGECTVSHFDITDYLPDDT